MRKEEQKKVNEIVLDAIDVYNGYVADRYSINREFPNSEKLRNCSAVVYDYDRYYALRSYNTIIAIIDKETDTLYDFLRYVYGYTATSAQHISKFEKDYCGGKWNCEHRYTYRPI